MYISKMFIKWVERDDIRDILSWRFLGIVVIMIV